MSHAINRVVPTIGGWALQDKNGRITGSYNSPQEAEQSSMAQSIMSGKPTEQLAPERAPFKPELNFGFDRLRSNMPKGASLSPKGDLGALRQREAMAAFKRPIKCPKTIVRAKDEFNG